MLPESKSGDIRFIYVENSAGKINAEKMAAMHGYDYNASLLRYPGIAD